VQRVSAPTQVQGSPLQSHRSERRAGLPPGRLKPFSVASVDDVDAEVSVLEGIDAGTHAIGQHDAVAAVVDWYAFSGAPSPTSRSTGTRGSATSRRLGAS